MAQPSSRARNGEGAAPSCLLRSSATAVRRVALRAGGTCSLAAAPPLPSDRGRVARVSRSSLQLGILRAPVAALIHLGSAEARARPHLPQDDRRSGASAASARSARVCVFARGAPCACSRSMGGVLARVCRRARRTPPLCALSHLHRCCGAHLRRLRAPPSACSVGLRCESLPCIEVCSCL